MGADNFALADKSLSCDELNAVDAYWRAANYLSVRQIYLLANPLLHEPLMLAHYQAGDCRPLRDHTWPELHLCPSEPGDQKVTISI